MVSTGRNIYLVSSNAISRYAVLLAKALRDRPGNDLQENCTQKEESRNEYKSSYCETGQGWTNTARQVTRATKPHNNIFNTNTADFPPYIKQKRINQVQFSRSLWHSADFSLH
jgi:hypothetical protein